MYGRLKLITPPTVEPVTVDDVKLHTHISHDVEDTLIAGWIKSGREFAEGFHNRSYLTQVYELSFDRFPCLPIALPRSPVSAVAWIRYYDAYNAEWTFDTANYQVDTDNFPARICLAHGVSWPGTTLRPMNAVKIRYTAGFGSTAASVPETVKDAIMLYCAHRNENRAGEEDIPETIYNLLRTDRLKPC
jgi:uncharacterized phiE125 gp8 family phage protein